MLLTPERRAELTRPGSCYVVCWVPDHPNDLSLTECQAGFFSLFIRALYGIRLAVQYDVPYYVDYGSVGYGYSDPDHFAGDTNFWNYYFIQPQSRLPQTGIVNHPYETFPLRIWNRSFRKRLHRIVQDHIQLQPAVREEVFEKKALFEDRKVLGVHIRRTDHPGEIEPVELSVYKRVIHQALPKYDRLFVATDDQRTLEAMIDEFGTAVMYNDVKRSVDGAPVHRLHPTEGRYELGLDALSDCYCLSFCRKIVIGQSNLSYAALLLDPTLTYTLLETPIHRNKRMKTALIYYWDQWSTRLPKL